MSPGSRSLSIHCAKALKSLVAARAIPGENQRQWEKLKSGWGDRDARGERHFNSFELFVLIFLLVFIVLAFWAAAPKGAMSYRIGGFCAYVRPSVRPAS